MTWPRSRRISPLAGLPGAVNGELGLVIQQGGEVARDRVKKHLGSWQPREAPTLGRLERDPRGRRLRWIKLGKLLDTRAAVVVPGRGHVVNRRGNVAWAFGRIRRWIDDHVGEP